jgi:hypothetical protein
MSSLGPHVVGHRRPVLLSNTDARRIAGSSALKQDSLMCHTTCKNHARNDALCEPLNDDQQTARLLQLW